MSKSFSFFPVTSRSDGYIKSLGTMACFVIGKYLGRDECK